MDNRPHSHYKQKYELHTSETEGYYTVKLRINN